MKSYYTIKILSPVFLICLLTLLVTSCLKFEDDNSALYAEQFEKMKESNGMVSTDSIGYNVFLKFLNYPENPDSAMVDPEDAVLISYEVYNYAQELIGTSYADKAKEHGIYRSDVIYGPAKYIAGYLIGGLYIGLSVMPENSEAIIIIPSEYATRKGPLKYIVKLHKIIKNGPLFETQQREAYMNAINFNDSLVKTAIDSTLWYKLTGNGNYAAKEINNGTLVTIKLMANYCEYIPGLLENIPGRQFYKIYNYNDTITYLFENTAPKNNFPNTPAIDTMVTILNNAGYRQAEFITTSANAYGPTGYVYPITGINFVPSHMSVHYTITLIDIKEY